MHHLSAYRRKRWTYGTVVSLLPLTTMIPILDLMAVWWPIEMELDFPPFAPVGSLGFSSSSHGLTGLRLVSFSLCHLF
jgi:hypothetical protein